MNEPKPVLTVADAVALIVGVVVGTGLFVSPALVALHTGGPVRFMAAWLLGGLVSLAGALCYAELAAAFPSAGGEYHFITRAYGRTTGFLFAWARLAVIQTGAIASLAFVFGDYCSQLVSFGPHAPAIYATLAVIPLTLVHMRGLCPGRTTQNVLTAAKIAGIALVLAAALFAAPPAGPLPPPENTDGAFGLAMVFVLYAYGGWNEAACISAELKNRHRGMLAALVLGIAMIATLYLLVNLAYLKGLGFPALAASEAVAADLLRQAWGDAGAKFVSILVAVCALSAASACIFTGARTLYAWGRDHALFAPLGVWNARRDTPAGALRIQGGVTVLLVLVGAFSQQGFRTMVEFTAPVFWLFLLLATSSLLVLRRTSPTTPRAFRVPFYPVTPLFFCSACAFMLYSGLRYSATLGGLAAWFGVVLVIAGIPLALLSARRDARTRPAA